jgi:hypothetical protein
MLIGEVLEATLTSLIADRAIERVVDKQHLYNAFASVEYVFVCSVLHYHAILHRRDA